MCDGADTPRSTQCGPRHSAGVVPAGVANISSTGFLNLSELCLITVCIRCSWRLEPITYARPPTDPCVCSPQLVEDLTTASKVVELVDASAHCQLQQCVLCDVLATYIESFSVCVCVCRVGQPVTCFGCYTHSGLEMAMFVGPGRECRVDLYKSETRMLKYVFSSLRRTILRGRYTSNLSSNSSPKPRN